LSVGLSLAAPLSSAISSSGWVRFFKPVDTLACAGFEWSDFPGKLRSADLTF
jgi:hypothetical protein